MGEAHYAPVTDCVFCNIIAGIAPGAMPVRWPDAVVLVPLNPVTDGHVLVLPRQHVRDAVENQWIGAAVMRRAVEYVQEYIGSGAVNLIANVGPEASQTVFHYHLHVVPRRAGDGLALPWTPSAVREEQERHGN